LFDIDNEVAWARLVFSAHAAPHKGSVSYSIRLQKDIEDVCVAAAKSVAQKGWQNILNAIVRVNGVWRDNTPATVLEFHPDGLDRIRCIAGEREFLISSNATGEFGTMETWQLAGAEVDSDGRVVIREAEFETDGIRLISGSTGNMSAQAHWWPEISELLLEGMEADATKEVVVKSWWDLFCSERWNDIELRACETWARKKIENGSLRMDQAPKQLESSRSYIIWRAQRLNKGHHLASGRKIRPHDLRRRAIAQITHNLNSVEPGSSALSDVERAIEINDGRKPTMEEAENALKRIYEDGYARSGPKSG
jgi:hypothetical protein